MLEFYTEVSFYLQLIVGLLIFRYLLPTSLRKRFRPHLILLLSLIFIAQLGSSFSTLTLTCCYSVFILAIDNIYVSKNSQSSRWSRVLIYVVVGVLLLVLCGFRLLTDSELIKDIVPLKEGVSKYRWVGLGFLSLRGITFLLRNRATQLSAIDGLGYLLFFPSFIAGPIFPCEPANSGITSEGKPLSAMEVVYRCSLGVIKVLFVSQWFYLHSVGSPLFQGTEGVLSIVSGIYCYFFYIYLEFSGYTDCAVSVALALGVRLPENFNFPFLSSNLQEFWNRWHISLSHWCREYIFFPIAATLSRRYSQIPEWVTTSISVLFTFVCLGLWHGFSFRWAFYGLLHGVGLVLLVFYRFSFECLLPMRYQRLGAHPIYAVVCTFATFSFVSFSFLMMLDGPRLARVLELLTGG